MAKCKYPGCDWDENSRPYARSGLMSVTTALNFANLGDKATGFAWAAAEIAATTAIHDMNVPHSADGAYCSHSHKVEPGLCKACKYVRYAHRKQWDEKAALGNHVHHLAVSWAKGEDIVSDEVVDPYLDRLTEFYRLYKPEWMELERTILFDDKPTPCAYVGTFDAIAEIDCPICDQGCYWLLDIKTGEGAHETEWALQLAAYRYAHNLTTWHQRKKWEQDIDIDMPKVDHCGVIHLHPNAPKLLVALDASPDMHDKFLQLLDLAVWEKSLRKEKDETPA
jgi:hypothetical protein